MLNKVTLSGFVLLLLVFSASCGGISPAGNSPAGPANQPGETSPLPPSLSFDSGDVSAGLPLRQINFADYISIAGNSLYRRSDNAIVDTEAGTTKLYSADENSWAIYQFGYLSHQEQPGAIVIEFKPPLPTKLFIGLADYGRQSWQWVPVEIVLPRMFVSIPAGIDPVSPDGRVYVLVSVPSKQFAEVKEIELWFDVSAPAPVNLTASDGEYFSAIRLSWKDPAITYEDLEYEAIEVLRLDQQTRQWTAIADLPPGTTEYFDIQHKVQNPLPYNVDLFYSVRTIADGQPGPAKEYAVGRRRAPADMFTATTGDFPDRVMLQWQAQPGVGQFALDYRTDPAEHWAELVSTDGSFTYFAHRWNAPENKECAVNTTYFYRLRPDTEGDVPWLPTAEGYRQVLPPRSLTASYGDYKDRIVLSWSDDTAVPMRYKVYRDGQDEVNVVATVEHQQIWRDYETDDFQHLYWVRSYIDTENYEFSLPAAGIVATTPWLNYDLFTGQNTHRAAFALIDGKPALAYYTVIDGTYPTEYDLRYAIASSATPGASSDWQFHIVEESAFPYCIALTEVNGVPSIAYYHDYPASGTSSLAYAQATSANPTSSADWQKHDLDVDGGYFCNLITVQGKPVICHGNSESELWYRQALNSTPSSSSDWHSHNVAELSLTPHAYNSITVINDKPVIAVESDGELYCLRALTSVPTSYTDWAMHAVYSSGFAHPGCSVINYNGAPAIAFVDENLDEMLVAQALTPLPSGAEDWSIHQVDYITYMPNNVSLVTVGGFLAMVYFDGYSTYKYAQATTAAPQGIASWHVEPIGAINGYGWNEVEVLSDVPAAYITNDDGSPRFAYRNN